jgi:tetratricopeptide (TPR) repeat protein
MKLTAGFSRFVGGTFLALTALALIGCDGQRTAQVSRQQAEQRWATAQADVKARLAADQLDAGNVEQAAAELGEARRLAPENAGLKVLEARVLLAEGSFARAEHLLKSAVRASDHSAEARYLLGVIEQQRLHWEAALEYYQSAAAKEPDRVDYVAAAVQVLLQLGRAKDGLTMLDECEDEVGWQSAWRASRAECFEQLGRWREAAGEWRRVSDARDQTDIAERLALALFRSHQWRDAVPILKQIVDGKSAAAASPLRLVLAECLLESGDKEAARRQVLTVLGKADRDPSALRLLARILAEQGHYERALAVAEQVLDIDPNDAVAAEYAAALAFKIGDMERADRWARRLVSAGGENANPIAARILKGSGAAPHVE